MLQEIQNKLSKMSDPKIAESARRFFKETVKMRGIKTANVIKLAREYFPEIDGMQKGDVFDLCEHLMASDYMEESFVACEFCYRINKKFEKSDFKTFEKWVEKYINNWAKCDTFCNHSINVLIEKFPELIPDIKKWSHSKNRWVRRGCAVTFILSARRGKFHDYIFEIADIMLTDADDMVQKGYGWALKAAGEYAPHHVYDFVTARVDKMPRTAYRYAIEKLPLDMRTAAMKIK